MKSFFLLILILPFICNILRSQDIFQIRKLQDSFLIATDDTSRINALRKIGTLYYNNGAPDSAIYYARKALAFSEKINWTKGIAQSALNLGADMQYISKYDSSVYFETKALAAAKIVGDKNRIALIYINRSNAYTETQQYEKAMADLTQAMRISEETGNKDRQARAAQSMCELYMYQRNNNDAMPWAEKALQLEKETGDEALQSVAEMCLGGLYSTKNDFQKAEAYLLDAVKKANKTNRHDVIIECSISLSDVYIKTYKPEKAIPFLQQGLANAQSLNLIDRAALVYSSLGDVYFAGESFTDALTSYKKGYEAIKGKKEFQQNQYISLEGMAKSYSALGDFKNAYESLSLASKIKDSALQHERNEKLLKLQTQFETERKEKQIALLKKDQQLNYASLERQKTFQYAAYIIFFLLVLIGFLIINHYRTAQRAKRTIEIEQMRNNIARNLHDDIGSTLTSINILSKVALQTETNNAAKTNMQKIKDRSASIMESMSDIVWAINPANDALDKIVLRMKEFGSEITEQEGIQFIFKEEEDLNDVKLSLPQRNNLYLIFKEAVNNAVKYSEAKEINISLKKEQDNLVLKIADDGRGFNAQQQFSGNGLKNMQSRANDMHAKLELQSVPDNGTTICLFVRIT